MKSGLREALYKNINRANLNKLIYRSVPPTLYRHTGRELIQLKHNLIRGYRGEKLLDNVDDKAKDILRILVDDNIDVAHESTMTLLNMYKLEILNETRRLEISLTILITIFIFIPIMGILLYSLYQDIYISITILYIQIILSEMLIRRLR
jgi:hypothetical protein